MYPPPQFQDIKSRFEAIVAQWRENPNDTLKTRLLIAEARLLIAELDEVHAIYKESITILIARLAK